MRKITISLMLVILALGSFLFWQNSSILRQFIAWASRGSEIKIFEPRYSIEDILKLHKKNFLLKHSEIQEASLLFYPYVMMDVKFPGNDGKAGKGILLWSLTDGEAVINGDSWEMTHGFAQALSSKPSKDALRLMHVISLYGGSVSKEILQKQLRLPEDKLNQVINETIDKNFVTNNAGNYRLASGDFHIDMAPETHFSYPLETKFNPGTQGEKSLYDEEQIIEMAKATFGSTFSIENSQIVYLPVYSIQDDHALTTWNAVTGKRMLLPSP